MITDTMTYQEVWGLIEQDITGSQYRLIFNKALKDIEKKVKKLKLNGIMRLPLVKYVSKASGLSHCLLIYALSAEDYKANGAVCVLYSYCHRKNGFYAFVMSEDNKLNIYTPHLFDRYRERFLKDPTIEKKIVIREFFKNNIIGRGSEKEIEKYPNSIFINTKDGAILGSKIEPNIYELRTFLNYDLLKGNQITESQINLTLIDQYISELYGTDIYE